MQLGFSEISIIHVFKIFSDKYQNRRKRFGLRFNLITGIYGYELAFKLS